MAQFFQPKKTQLNTKHQQVLVEKLDHYGAGIGYLSGKPVFIEGALPDEKVVVQLTESKKKFARANLIKVLTPSPKRVQPFCRYYSECGGCNMQHLEHSAQLEYKQSSLSHLMKVASGQSIPLQPAVVANEKGYRRRTRISTYYHRKSASLQFGFRKKSSNQIVNVDHCPVLVPELNTLLPDLKVALQQLKQQDALGHIELVKADSGVVLLVRNTKALPECDITQLTQFAQQFSLSLFLLPNDGKLVKLLGDTPSYRETGCEVSFSPDGFIQVNQAINEKMVSQAIQWLDVSEQDRVLDLFCGVGNFSLALAKLTSEVVGVEGVPSMVEQATHNAQLNQLNNTDFFHANLEESLDSAKWAAKTFDKVLLDPARAGAGVVINNIAAMGASRVVYVSCNPATLARDSESLYQQGFRLEKLAMLDMFPHTSHLESMALFVRN
ncbi:23S rRNA (uracil(1939)-C(5))-methyltransferase RlmD [Vibrio sp. S4M6]|uniref:23S rRNA (uracil(1939)-C(5))-methyltransferase RlmD n=1 Tax=Vibrio sinus TaxID=2946865 RepID=UPI002029FDB2|nr:23S rRNA (uracil(1939)-C(5))-methyltransferase RlmD [Vibrio sinus]MCL9781516.1 23S rRNA (uracil(1939)-C(5))-methyltransferase RlmD [Vibrio sinus]